MTRQVRSGIALIFLIAATATIGVTLLRPTSTECGDPELPSHVKVEDVSVARLPRWLGERRIYWVCAHQLTNGASIQSYIGHYDDEPWIGQFPGLQEIRRGMTRSEVERLLGRPTRVQTKTASEHVFGQGENEAQIREGWIYSPQGWDGAINVYFDASGHVLYEGHGHG